MKTFLTDIIPKIQQFSKQLDDVSTFAGKHWVLIDNVNNSKNVYIFRTNNELLISQNGKVDKAKWEYLGNRFLLIDLRDSSYLFKLDFNDDSVLALKVDSSEEYAFFINETKFGTELNSYEKVLDFLRSHYLGKVNILKEAATLITKEGVKEEGEEFENETEIGTSEEEGTIENPNTKTQGGFFKDHDTIFESIVKVTFVVIIFIFFAMLIAILFSAQV